MNRRLRAVAAALAAGVTLAGASAAQAAELTAGGLEANANPRPLGIDDPTPALSWRLTSPDRGVAQTKYRVVVATTAAKAEAGEGDVWDSGEVGSGRSSVVYGGSALASRTRYFWSVRSWAGGTASGWAKGGWFETSYLSPSDWKGTWISGPQRLAQIPTNAQGAADDECCLKGDTTLYGPAAAGDTNLKVNSVLGFFPGQTLTLDSGAAQETTTVASVGTGAPRTTTAAPLATGDTNVKLNSVANLTVGSPLTIGTQTVTISSVGTAAVTTTLAAPVSAGDATLHVASVNGFSAGANILVGAPRESATVATVGTAQQQNRTLQAPAAAGDTNIKVNNVGGFVVGQPMIVNTGANLEKRVVTAVGTTGATGTGITFTPALSNAHPQGTGARGLGSGITLTAALTGAHAASASVVNLGTGVTFAPALTGAHDTGTAVSAPGSGITLTGALTKPHAEGATLVGPTPRDICRPVAASPNAGQCKPVRPSIFLRKSFNVAPVSEHGAVTSARLYSSGLGWNEATVNGTKTDPTGWLNPGFTEYNDTVQYVTDDVTALIKQDATAARENVVASELGAGRYDSESVPSDHHFEDAQWRAEETLRADLYIKYADGTEQLVKSDDTWKTSIDGPIRYNDFDTGETYDARQQLPGWDTAAHDTASWASARTVMGPAGKLIAQKHERTALVDSIKGPFPRWTISPGVYGFDTLKQRVGWAKVKIWGAARGQVIRVYYVERRNNDPALPGPQDGALAPPGNLQQQYYVSDGTGTEANPEVFTQKFNFSGFQWIQIAGSAGAALPDNVQVDVESVEEVRTDLPEVGEFTASSPLLNVIHTAVKGSVAGNHMAGYMMDTPTYEKDGWSGDTQLAAPIASLLFDTQRQWQKSAIDVVDSQIKAHEYPDMLGQVNFLIPGSSGYGYCSQAQPVTPANMWTCAQGSYATRATTGPSIAVFKNANGGASPIWDSMLHVMPWEAYNRYADTYGLRTAYDAMKLYLDVTMEKWRKAPDYTPPSGSREDEHTVFSFLGDWTFPTGADGNAAERTNVNAAAVTSIANTAYYAYMAKLTADSARVLGHAEDAAKYDALYERIKRDFNARFWDAAKGYYVDPQQTAFMSQAAQILPLAMGLVPAEHKRALQEKLVQDVLVTRTGHQLTGIASARWIYPVLTEAAHEGVPNAAKAAYTAAQQTTYPSYGYWFQTLGFTGVGEMWEQSTRTRNHEMYGTIAQWFYEHVLGIQNAEPGFKKITIRPLISPDGIASASGSYDSVQGLIKSDWSQSEKGITMKVTIPANTTARVYVPGANPDAVGEIGSGRALLAKRAPGVSLVGVEQDAVVFEVGSGDYTFVVGEGLFKAVEVPGTVGGTVPATLSLSLAGPASFEPFVPGVAKEYTASTTANVISTAGDATLSVSAPGHLTNGAFTLPEPLRVELGKASWTAPVSNESVAVTFKQLIKANDALRTGTYSKTLTFTLSTTTP